MEKVKNVRVELRYESWVTNLVKDDTIKFPSLLGNRLVLRSIKVHTLSVKRHGHDICMYI